MNIVPGLILMVATVAFGSPFASPTPMPIDQAAPAQTTTASPKPTSPFSLITYTPEPTRDPSLIVCYNCPFTDPLCAFKKAKLNATASPTGCRGPYKMNCLNLPYPSGGPDDARQSVMVYVEWARMNFIRPKQCRPITVKHSKRRFCYECGSTDLKCLFAKVKARDTIPECPYERYRDTYRACVHVNKGKVFQTAYAWSHGEALPPQCK